MTVANSNFVEVTPSNHHILGLLEQGTWQLSSELNRYFSTGDAQTKVQQVLTEAIKRKKPVDFIALTEKISYFINAENFGIKSEKELLKAARTRLSEAKYYLTHTVNKEVPPSLQTWVDKLIHAIDALIDTMINAFALSDVFKHPENELQASFRFQKMVLLSSLIPAVATVLAPFIGISVSSALFTVGSLFVLIGMSIVYSKYMRPLTNDLLYSENWTDSARRNLFVNICERRVYSDRLAAALREKKIAKAHPLLIGKRGIGKSNILKSFVHSVVRGDYPDLKGKKVFYYKMHNLVETCKNGNSFESFLKNINSIIGRHKDEALLIFDGIERLLKKDDKQFTEPLAHYLSNNPDGLAHVIAVIREDDYTESLCKEHSELADQFQPIFVTSSFVEETAELLVGRWLKTYPELFVEPGVFEYIASKTTEEFREAVQPALSLTILDRCMRKAAMSTVPNEKRRLFDIRQKQRVEESRRLSGEVKIDNHLRREEADIQDSILEKEKAIRNLVDYQLEIVASKIELYQSILKVLDTSAVQGLIKNRQYTLKYLHLIENYLIPSLKTKVETEASTLHIKIAINKDLVDEVLKEEKERRAI